MVARTYPSERTGTDLIDPRRIIPYGTFIPPLHPDDRASSRPIWMIVTEGSPHVAQAFAHIHYAGTTAPRFAFITTRLPLHCWNSERYELVALNARDTDQLYRDLSSGDFAVPPSCGWLGIRTIEDGIMA